MATSIVTLKDLSKKLGLSVPTVSLALRNAGNISRATCLRVQAAAREILYKPNVYATALSAGNARGKARQMPLAVLRRKVGNLVYPVDPFVHALEDSVATLGYRLENCFANTPAEMKAELGRLNQRGIQGLFIGPVDPDFDLSDGIWESFSIVQCGRYNHPAPVHSVRSECFDSARFLFAETVRRGYRRIGVVLFQHEPPLLDDFGRRGGIWCGENCLGLDVDKVSVLTIRPGDVKTIVPWCKREKLDAIISFSVDIYHHLVASRIRIPADLGFSTFHYSDDASNRQIGGMREKDADLGAVAAQLMDSLIRDHERGIPPIPRTLVIGREWVEGTTLPPREKSPTRIRRKPAVKAEPACQA